MGEGLGTVVGPFVGTLVVAVLVLLLPLPVPALALVLALVLVLAAPAASASCCTPTQPHACGHLNARTDAPAEPKASLFA